MQSPAEIDAHIDLIIAQAASFVKEGTAEDNWQAHHRHHYLRSATMLLADWRGAQPCPILYARFYARQRPLAAALTQLGQRVLDDFDDLGIAAPNPAYASPPPSTFEYLVDEDGTVGDIVERSGSSHWPSIPAFLLPDVLAALPRHGIGDVWSPEGTCDAAAAAPLSSDPAAPVEARSERRAPAAPHRPRVQSMTASALLEKFLAEQREETDSRVAERDVQPYVLFAIHIMGDRAIGDYGRDDIRELCLALTRIPHTKNMQVQSPIERYQFAEKHGWADLKRLSETTIENRYICALKRFWAWAKEAGFYEGDLPTFRLMGRKNTAPLARDSFTDVEVKALFSSPTFTGHMRGSRNKPGPVLRQDHIYWSYVIMIFTGMRPAEIAQLRLEDLRFSEGQGIYYFDLRLFDPAAGRVAREDIVLLKTVSSARLVPVHPALIELGLLERANRLIKLGHKRLLSDCQPKVLNGVDLKWSYALSKDWQSRKASVTNRANVTAYSGRHSMADLLRELGLSTHDCEKFLGHSHQGVNGRYGRKGAMPDKIVDAFMKMDAPIMLWLRDHLVAARDRIENAGLLIEDWAHPPLPGAR